MPPTVANVTFTYPKPRPPQNHAAHSMLLSCLASTLPAPSRPLLLASRLWLGWLPYPERQHIPITTLQQPTAAAAPATPAAAPQPVGPTFPSATSGSSTTAAAGAATAAACSPASSPRGCSYSLWPLDRAESRGQLKALTLRLGAGEAVVLSYKSLAWWQVGAGGKHMVEAVWQGST